MIKIVAYSNGEITLNNNSINLTFDDKVFIFNAPVPLKKISKVLKFDISTGYMIIKTNYGEEYIDIKHLHEKENLIYKGGKSTMVKEKKIWLSDAILVIEKIAFFKQGNSIIAVNTEDKTKRLELHWGGDMWLKGETTFSRQKIFEAMYYAEINKEILTEELIDA